MIMASKLSAIRHRQKHGVDVVDMDGSADRIPPQGLPSGDVAPVLVRARCGVEVDVYSYWISDVEGAGAFEGDEEEIGHRVSQHQSSPKPLVSIPVQRWRSPYSIPS